MGQPVGPAARRGSSIRPPWAAGESATLADADEEAADSARANLRAGRREAFEPDERIASLLLPGEAVLAAHDDAILRDGCTHARRARGPLYLTSRRLVLAAGDVVAAYDVERVEEAAVVSGHLLVLMDGGACLEVLIARPRLLRVQIAMARAARRTGRTKRSCPVRQDSDQDESDR